MDDGDIPLKPVNLESGANSSSNSWKVIAFTLVAGTVFMFVFMILVGVIVGQTRQQLDLQTRQAKKYCADSTRIMDNYCTKPAHFGRCFDMVDRVEGILLGASKKAIFDLLAALEPQTGAITVWGVDESTENEDSHLDLSTVGTATYFNNSAYYYSQEAHVNSVLCGGWSLGFWKTRAFPGGPNITRSIQLAYCEDNRQNIRVCGAFNVYAE